MVQEEREIYFICLSRPIVTNLSSLHATKIFLKDTTINLNPKTYTTQYITESPTTDEDYIIVTVPLELKGTQGKVRVQIVNLATDWGAIDVWQVDRDNRLVTSALPLNLDFAEYSAYVELDIASADSNNNLLLKFRKHGETEG